MVAAGCNPIGSDPVSGAEGNAMDVETTRFIVSTQLTAMGWVFGWLVFFLALRHINNRHRQKKLELIYKERLAAMDKGIPLPELPDYDEKPTRLVISGLRPNPRWPLGLGALTVMLGIGVTVALLLSGDPYHQQIWPFGLIGVFFGVGLFLHYALTRERR
jgi:hypothetical protein